MLLIGEKFATYLMNIDGELSVVKMEDYTASGRDCVRCYREYLAFRLASHIDLDVPPTRLRRDPRYGRLSVQQYIPGAKSPTRAALAQMTNSAIGIRIALFDILCRNHDRKPDNLLQSGADIIPIDFNTAFQATNTTADFDLEVETLLARWFKIQGLLSLKPLHRAMVIEEVYQLIERLDEVTLEACVTEIPPYFCDRAEAELVCRSLIRRRNCLLASISAWWDKNITPLHEFDCDMLRTAIRGHVS